MSDDAERTPSPKLASSESKQEGEGKEDSNELLADVPTSDAASPSTSSPSISSPPAAMMREIVLEEGAYVRLPDQKFCDNVVITSRYTGS